MYFCAGSERPARPTLGPGVLFDSTLVRLCLGDLSAGVRGADAASHEHPRLSYNPPDALSPSILSKSYSTTVGIDLALVDLVDRLNAVTVHEAVELIEENGAHPQRPFHGPSSRIPLHGVRFRVLKSASHRIGSAAAPDFWRQRFPEGDASSRAERRVGQADQPVLTPARGRKAHS